MNPIHENIKAIRLEKRYSQEDIADMLGISQSSYQKIEKGLTDINYSRLLQIAEVFGMSVTEIISYPDGGGAGDSDRVKELEKEVADLREWIKDKSRLNEQMTNKLMDLSRDLDVLQLLLAGLDESVSQKIEKEYQVSLKKQYEIFPKNFLKRINEEKSRFTLLELVQKRLEEISGLINKGIDEYNK